MLRHTEVLIRSRYPKIAMFGVKWVWVQYTKIVFRKIIKSIHESCSKRIAYCVVAWYPRGTWGKKNCIAQSCTYTMKCTCVHKSNWKIDDLPFEYTQSLTNVVKSFGKCCQEGVKTGLHKSSLWDRLFFETKYLLKFLLFTDLLMCLMTGFVDWKKKLFWVRVDRKCTQITKAKACILWWNCTKRKWNCCKRC